MLFTTSDPKTNHRMKIMLISMGILFGSIFAYKGIASLIFSWFMAHHATVIPVSAMQVATSAWEPQITASGNLRAVNGVNVTPEVAGTVKTLFFTPGASVKQNAVLVQLKAESDIALLNSLEANAELANVTLIRDRAQYAVRAVSKQTLDADKANLKSLRAQVAQQAAIVKKKTIRAPFDGRLGICNVNLGQYVSPGDRIVSLQMLDPIYVDFFAPQQSLARLAVGQSVTISSDTYPGRVYTGKITTINPAVDSSTRNVEVEATIANAKLELTPGMFATVTVNTGVAQKYLTLPQTAISFNPYGELVYIIRESGEKSKGVPLLIAKQAFVVTGETRGDQVVILSGLKEGDTVVTSGQLKLKNDMQVAINNTIMPPNSPTPSVPDEH